MNLNEEISRVLGKKSAWFVQQVNRIVTGLNATPGPYGALSD